MIELTAAHRTLMKLRLALTPHGPHGDRRRGALYERYMAAVGENFKVASGALIYNPNGLRAGNHVYIGFGSYLGQGEITLDDEVLIGTHVSIVASNHLRKNGSYRFGGYKAEPIHIGRGTWIAAHSVITAGVTIGSGCVVAAGAVVTRSFGDNLVIAGVPATALRTIEDDSNE